MRVAAPHLSAALDQPTDHAGIQRCTHTDDQLIKIPLTVLHLFRLKLLGQSQAQISSLLRHEELQCA